MEGIERDGVAVAGLGDEEIKVCGRKEGLGSAFWGVGGVGDVGGLMML